MSRNDDRDDGITHSPAAINPPTPRHLPERGDPGSRTLSITDPDAPKTAFVFAGGGSFGAVQVGMLQALAAHGVAADMVVGSSVGALNGAFYAGDPTVSGVARLAEIWRGLNRQDVFPVTWRTLVSFLWRRDFLIPHDGVRRLIDDYIPFRNLEDARIPIHIVTTDIISGDSVVLSEGSTAEAIVASTAIPGAFTPVHYRDRYLADGAISSNTPVRVAVKHGAKRLIVLPTGHACANQAPPIGALANALHALTLLIAGNSSTSSRISVPVSSISWCRRSARWSARPTISPAPRIISRAPSTPPTPGSTATA